MSLTSLTEENANKRVDELYPKHFNALERANLTQAKSYPSLCEALLLLQQQDEPPPSEPTPDETAAQAKRERDKARTIWFCIGYSKIWGTPISK